MQIDLTFVGGRELLGASGSRFGNAGTPLLDVAEGAFRNIRD